jgi:hypothetical protein
MTPVFVVTFGDIFGLIAFAVFLLIAACYYIKEAWKQSRCKHDDGVNETMACDAICRKCGKNLGFIGNWRNKK